jgi:hypothetical protein
MPENRNTQKEPYPKVKQQQQRLETNFFVDERSPEETVREARGRSLEEGSAAPAGQVMRIPSGLDCLGFAEGGARRLIVPLPKLSSDDLVTSWINRHPAFPAAAERWSPLRSVTTGDQRVLLLGVGSGAIGGALPLGWHVTGVELAKALQGLGHDSTTYQPPGLAGRFTLHPISWELGGNVLTPQVQDALEREVEEGRYTLVIVDVEGVPNEARLSLRARLAKGQTLAYCRILVSSHDADEVVASFHAYRSSQDQLWTTESYPHREFIMGGTSNPIGVYTAVPSPNRYTPYPDPPSRADYDWTGYPPYNPGPDLLTLTGHVPTLPSTGATYAQCRAVHSYLPRPLVAPLSSSPPTDLHQLCVHLLTHHCPRKRIRSLISLHHHHLLHLSTFFIHRRQ